MRCLLICAALPLLAHTLIAQPSTPAIRVPVRLVVVPTLVFSSDDHLVSGLERGNFRVFDNGSEQHVALAADDSPVSIVIVVQINQDVREYIPFVAKVGSVLESILVGATGEAALITYSDEVTTVTPFVEGDLASALRGVRAAGRKVRLLDAGSRGLMLLRHRPASRDRFLVIIGQPLDSGSETMLEDLKSAAEAENVTVFGLTLPEFGKSFVSDNFWLQGPASAAERGGFKAGVNLGKLISVLSDSEEAGAGTDPVSVLTGATGGAQFHVRKQQELEHAIAGIGLEMRSAYRLSYTPSSNEPGYHAIRVEVDVPNAKLLSRPGYWRAD